MNRRGVTLEDMVLPGEGNVDMDYYGSVVTAHRRYGSVHDSCSICLESFPWWKQMFFLPCMHGFHRTCLRQWVDAQSTLASWVHCPVCRKGFHDSSISEYLPKYTTYEEWMMHGSGLLAPTMCVQCEPKHVLGTQKQCAMCTQYCQHG
jgi:hypothetical protein